MDKLTYSQVSRRASSTVLLVCIEAHPTVYFYRGKDLDYSYERGEVKRRRNIRGFKKEYWRLLRP